MKGFLFPRKAELLAVVVGGAQQIKVAVGLLFHFGGDIQCIYKGPLQKSLKYMAFTSKHLSASRPSR